VSDRILQSQDSALGLSFISNVRILLTHSDHDSLMTRTADDRWKDSAGSIITGKACLAHSRTIVDDQSGDFFFSHFCLMNLKQKKKLVM
jgi:hypothetical protein